MNSMEEPLSPRSSANRNARRVRVFGKLITTNQPTISGRVIVAVPSRLALLGSNVARCFIVLFQHGENRFLG